MIWHVDVTEKQWPEVIALRAEYLKDHTSDVPHIALIEGARTGAYMILSLGFLHSEAQGYAVCHLAQWEGIPCLVVDEVYVVPSARGKGLFGGFVTWLNDYKRVTGVRNIFTVARTREEFAPWDHVGATAAFMSLNLNGIRYEKGEKKNEIRASRDPGFNVEQAISGEGHGAVARKGRGRPRGSKNKKSQTNGVDMSNGTGDAGGLSADTALPEATS